MVSALPTAREQQKKPFLNTKLLIYVCESTEKEMCGLKWGELYERFHKTAYNQDEVASKVRELYESFYVKEKKGIYEYILDGCQNTKLLNVRVFDEPTKKAVYAQQTAAAREKGESNCPLCAIGHDANHAKIRPKLKSVKNAAICHFSLRS